MLIKSKKAFTLIELLVVVLIIAILAAIALPKYKRIVDKTRLVQSFVTLTAIAKGERNYYLAHGEWTKDLRKLDIGFENGHIESTGQSISFNNYVCYTACPNAGCGGCYLNENGKKVVIFGFWKNSFLRCYALSTDEKANELCQLVSQRNTHNKTSGNYNVYLLTKT